MENYVEIETYMPIELSLPRGVVVPDTGVTARKAEILLTASQLEQVRTALEHGKRIIQTRLTRTKKPVKRCTTEIEGNVISSVMKKTEHCKPVRLYPVEVLAAELEAIIYCLERSKNSKSKGVQQLIASLSAYFDYEGKAMPNGKSVTRSGAVYEVEYYPVSETVRDFSKSKPKPVNVRTDEEKARYNNYKSEKHFVRLVNTNFTSAAYYVTLTYDNEHLPPSYAEAVKNLENYVRRLRYSNPHAKIIAVTGFGSRSGRLHHHLIVSGVSENDILCKWAFGEIAKVEHLRKDNYYNGINHGEDFTALGIYLHQHTPAEHKGKRWKQTKSIQQPAQEKVKPIERVYSPERPPKAPKGFMFVEARTSDYYKSGYVYFKYVRIPCEPLNIQPNFSKHKQLSECQRL